MAKFLDYTGLSYLWGKITAALATKQNTLTPGSNITISNDTISATDTNRPIAIYTADGATTLFQNNDKRELRLYATESADNIILHKMYDLDERVVLRITAKNTYPDDWMYNDSLPDITGFASNTSWSRLNSFELPESGTWLISAAVQYPANATGFRSVGLYIGTATNPTDVTGIRFQQTVQAANGAATNLVLTAPATISSTRTCWIMGRQNSGSALGTTSSPVRTRVSAIRLTPKYT